MFNPGGKSGYYEGKRVEVNDKTKQFQHYYVSFLLKDGRLIDFIHLGIFFEDYKDSLKIAETISEHWCIPLVTCQDDCTFEVKRNYGGDYYLSANGIEKGSVLKRLGVIFLIILLVIVVTWIISLFNNKQKNRYNYGYPTYHHRRY